MRLIDMHCDTIFELFRRKSMNLYDNSLCVDLKKMQKTGSIAQFFACFIYMKMFQEENRWEKGYQYALHMIRFAKEMFEKYPRDIKLATSYETFLENELSKKLSAFLTIEEGGIIDGKIENLEKLYGEGIRLVTLTWNEENCIGFPNSRDTEVMNQGLKSFGIEVIERMNELGMLIDVSHLSDGGFWDVLRYSKKPVVASHSNARTLCSHPRNLSDEMIHALAEQGGIAGVNFYPYFVNLNGTENANDLVRHIEYMYRKGGEEFVAIGTDFDGFDDGETEFHDIGEMGRLYHALKMRGFSDRQLEKFWNGNARRMIETIL